MGWGIGSGSKAGKVYQKRMLTTMLLYVSMVMAASSIVRHGHPVGWHLYFWAIAPAVPVMFVLVYLGIYLRDETDEYMRMIAIRSLLVATGALLATIVVNDFLRSYTPIGPLPPFTGFVLFFVSFGVAQGVQQMMNRGGGDD
jgi:hypothetical protein